MAYDLHALGPTGFQDLGAALCVRCFGAGVQVMGSGRDGGRDMYYRGSLIWTKSEDQPAEAWDGYTVFQVKHKATLGRADEDVAWLWAQFKAELDRWTDPRSDRREVPDHLLLVTNVALTPFPGSGGHDRLIAAFDKYVSHLTDGSRDIDGGEERRERLARVRRIKSWRLWDANQVRSLLDAYGDVRRAFVGFLTVGDVLVAVAGSGGHLDMSELGPALSAHARTSLIGESNVYFDEAGSGDSAGTPLHEVAIDLPLIPTADAASTTAIRHVLARGEHCLKPGVGTIRGPRHIVLAGAPGNGKTTVSKFLVQAYRSAFLTDFEPLSPEHLEVMRGVGEALTRLSVEAPRNRRWPVRVDLAEYAQDQGPRGEASLTRYVAERVSARLNTAAIKPWLLASWLKQWPSFVMLDGLDEVTEPSVRKGLIQRIIEFAAEADAEGHDTLIVLTTRPMGYVENIAPTLFERVDMADLDLGTALAYGTLATRVRFRGDHERIDKVVAELKRAAADDSLRLLLRTPLQVLIVAIIIAGAGRLAPDRFSLFSGYYDTVFRRERSKPRIGIQRILQEHAPQINELHERVGFDLQVRSESSGRATAYLTSEELTGIAGAVLRDAGFKPDREHGDLLTQVVTAATHRLVLIAPRGNDGLGFDVRSLQELMAAAHLTNGPPDVVAARLRLAAPNPHWRNTWLFAAGRLFASNQTHNYDSVVDLVETLDVDAGWRLGGVLPVGPSLALEIVDDGMAQSLPKWRDRLFHHGMNGLADPSFGELAAGTCLRLARRGDVERRLVAAHIRAGLSAGLRVRTATARLQDHIADLVADNPALALGLPAIKPAAGASAPAVDIRTGWSGFDDEIATYPLRGDEAQALQWAAAALRTMGAVDAESASDATSTPDGEHAAVMIAEALALPDVARGLDAALAHIAEVAAPLLGYLAGGPVATIHRQPVGGLLTNP